jgi:hypothetical protein
MLTTASFIEMETRANKWFAKDLLNRIENLKVNGLKECCYSFNVYDLEIDLNKHEVTIRENLFEDCEDFLKLSLADFIDALLGILNK